MELGTPHKVSDLCGIQRLIKLPNNSGTLGVHLHHRCWLMQYAPKGDQFRKKYNYLRIHYESCIFLSLETPVPCSPSDFQNLLCIPQGQPNNGKWNDTGYHGIWDPKVS